jgi:hypothetical protein
MFGHVGYSLPQLVAKQGKCVRHKKKAILISHLFKLRDIPGNVGEKQGSTANTAGPMGSASPHINTSHGTPDSVLGRKISTSPTTVGSSLPWFKFSLGNIDSSSGCWIADLCQHP